MAINRNGNNFTYSIGSSPVNTAKKSQETRYGYYVSPSAMGNDMSGVTANAIYQAANNGNIARTSPYGTSDTGSTDVPKNPTGGGRAGSKTSSSLSASASTGGGGGAGYDYMGMIQSMLDQQRAAAQAAYDASRARLEEAWGQTQSSLQANLESALNNLRANYDYGAGVARNDAKQSLRDAYINYMLSRRNMGQNMAALGLSGGATESNLAKMYNNYGTSKNNIHNTLAGNLQELMNTYNNNAAAANQAYNSQYAEAMNNYVANLNALEQALAQNQMGSYSGSSLSNLASYAATLAELQNSMNNATANLAPTENTLEVSNVSTTQGTDPGSVTDYARYQAMIDNMAREGANQNSIVQALKNNGVDLTTAMKLLGVA